MPNATTSLFSKPFLSNPFHLRMRKYFFTRGTSVKKYRSNVFYNEAQLFIYHLSFILKLNPIWGSLGLIMSKLKKKKKIKLL